jgi:hypothetical protein
MGSAMRHLSKTVKGWPPDRGHRSPEADAALHRALRQAFGATAKMPLPGDLVNLARRVGSRLDARHDAGTRGHDAASGKSRFYGIRRGR